MERRPLAPGKLTVESRRGSSSHQHNPFVALLSKDANEDHGDVYGFSLVYSGNFAAHAEVEPYGQHVYPWGLIHLISAGCLSQDNISNT